MSTQPADGGGGNTITDRQLFDQATAPDPTPAPSPAPSQPSQIPSDTGGATEAPVPSTRPDLQQQPPAQTGQQPRDPTGKFAPKPQGQQPQQQLRQPEDHRVPLREMLDERERRQRVEAEYQQLLRYYEQQQQQQQKPQGPETIFDAPDEYLNHRVVAPLMQHFQMEMMKRTEAQSREFANVQFGEAAVNAALNDLQAIRPTPQGDFVFRQIMSSGHPYGALIKWHNQARAHAAIGNDPQAWLKQQQQAWFNDPKVQEAMVNHLRARHQQQNGSGNNPPNVSLPPSLSSVPSSSGRTDGLGDLSSESLYAQAIK